MDSCPHCSSEASRRQTINYGLGSVIFELNENYPYCSRKCFDAAIDAAIEHDKHNCRICNQIKRLRDDAELRVANIENLSYDAQHKLEITKNYFQARADVLNDILMVMNSDVPCSCV